MRDITSATSFWKRHPPCYTDFSATGHLRRIRVKHPIEGANPYNNLLYYKSTKEIANRSASQAGAAMPDAPAATQPQTSRLSLAGSPDETPDYGKSFD
jgi:hypothetical protein